MCVGSFIKLNIHSLNILFMLFACYIKLGSPWIIINNNPLKALSTDLPNLIQGQQTPLSILPRLAKQKPSFLVHCLQIIKKSISVIENYHRERHYYITIYLIMPDDRCIIVIRERMDLHNNELFSTWPYCLLKCYTVSQYNLILFKPNHNCYFFLTQSESCFL
jgi:hypothetical protein